MTDRLYYHDSYLKQFEARVVDANAERTRVYLDRTGFYPTSGGQPFDTGVLGGVPVIEVVDEEDRIAHVLNAPLRADTATAEVDWARRFDHMQQHTGQHLLSAVFVELLDAKTLSFHLGSESATIDIGLPQLSTEQAQAVERRANELVFENRPVTVTFQDASEATDLRKASERQGLLRIISINGLDRSACGGTHVRATGEIGPILLRKMEKIRGSVRVEFVCGLRAVRRARADYEGLAQIARAFSAPLDATPGLVMAQLEKAQEADKLARRLSAELAAARGRESYGETPAGSDGVRRRVQRVAEITEEVRAEAQSFAAGSRAALLIMSEKPAAVLVAVARDTGWNAGQWLKAGLAELGGRGGGSATLAQGSLPSSEGLSVLERSFLDSGSVHSG